MTTVTKKSLSDMRKGLDAEQAKLTRLHNEHDLATKRVVKLEDDWNAALKRNPKYKAAMRAIQSAEQSIRQQERELDDAYDRLDRYGRTLPKRGRTLLDAKGKPRR